MKTLTFSLLSFLVINYSLACDINNLPWLQVPDCNSCISSVEVVTYNNQTYIVFWGDNQTCADAITTVYDCQGNVFCQQGGIAGLQQCNAFLTSYTYQSTLWSQTIDCCIDPSIIDPDILCPAIFDPVCGCDWMTYANSCIAMYYNGVTNYTQGVCSCDINNLPWLSFPTCDDCVSSVEAFQFNGNLYFVFWGDNQNCTDAITTVYDCQGNIFCQQGGIAGLQQCNNFFSNATLVSTLWNQQDFCCIDPGQIDLSAICPLVFDPVCGCDDITYGNACEAIYYGGVTSYTQGICGTCDFNDLAWLQLPNCYNCISEVELIVSNGVGYVVFWGDDQNCADAITTVYDCCGEVVCLDGGFAGYTQCDNIFNSYISSGVIWSQANDCCVPYLDLGNQTINTGLYKAAIQVRSGGTINNNSNVRFTAGDNVELYNNFSSPTDANFSAEIEDCQ